MTPAAGEACNADGHSLLPGRHQQQWLPTTRPSPTEKSPPHRGKRTGQDAARRHLLYITVYNEPYVQPPEPENFDPEACTLQEYLTAITRPPSSTNKAQILASGGSVPAALRSGTDAQAAEWDVAADVWSVTSWRRAKPRQGGHRRPSATPDRPAGVPYVTRELEKCSGPGDRDCRTGLRAVPEQIRPWVPGMPRWAPAGSFPTSARRSLHFSTDAPNPRWSRFWKEALAGDGEDRAWCQSRPPASTGSATLAAALSRYGSPVPGPNAGEPTAL